jgi:hypothetical protein
MRASWAAREARQRAEPRSCGTRLPLAMSGAERAAVAVDSPGGVGVVPLDNLDAEGLSAADQVASEPDVVGDRHAVPRCSCRA